MNLNESIVEDATPTWFLLRPTRDKATAGDQSYGGQVGTQPSSQATSSGLRPTRLGYAIGHRTGFATLRHAKEGRV